MSTTNGSTTPYPTFTGTYTAIITPFMGDGSTGPFRNASIDYLTYDRLVREQIAGGVDGIVPVGTTGESPTLDKEEHIEIIRHAVELVHKIEVSPSTDGRGRPLILAGTGSNCTAEAIELTQAAEEVGADGILSVAPYYNKPPQEGLYAHFEAIAESTKLPIVLYSIPGRTGVTIETDTMVRLAENHANIVGLKAAGGAPDVERTAHLLGRMREISRPDFTVLSGDDSLTLPFMRAGASGVISVASNIIPTEVSEMVRAQAGGDTTRADAINKRYARLFGAEAGLFIGGNPASVKAAMEMLGRISSGAMRLPLVPISDEKRAILRETLHNCGLLRRPALRPVEEFATQ